MKYFQLIMIYRSIVIVMVSKIAKPLLYGLSLTMLIFYYYLCLEFSLNFPMNHDDGRHFLYDYGLYLSGELSLIQYLINPKNGCPHFIDRLINVLSNLVNGETNFRFILFTGNLSIVTLLFVLKRYFSISYIDFFFTTLILSTPIAYTMLFPTCVGTYNFVIILFIVAMVNADKLVREFNFNNLFYLLISSVILLFTFCNGFIGVMLIISYITLKSLMLHKNNIKVILSDLILLIFLIAYFYFYVSSNVNPHTGSVSLTDKIILLFKEHFLDCLYYMFAYVGVPFKYLLGKSITSQYLAIAFSVITFLYASYAYFKYTTSRKISVLYFTMIFMLMTAGISYIARLVFNFWVPRYENFGIVYLLAVVLIFLDGIKSHSKIKRVALVLFSIIIFYFSGIKYSHNYKKLVKTKTLINNRIDKYCNEKIFIVHPSTGGKSGKKIHQIKQGITFGEDFKFYYPPCKLINNEK